MIKSTQQRHLKKRLLVLFLLALAAIIAVTAAFHVGPFTRKTALAGSQYTKGEGTNNNLSSGQKEKLANTPGTGSSSQGDKSKTVNSPSAPLIAPTGNFVSNHRPNLSGSPAPNSMASVCNTTPGAVCTIVFSKDGVSKSLPSKTIDQGGSAIWSWNLQDTGLTEGSWKVQAIVTLNGDSKNSFDALDLEVTP